MSVFLGDIAFYLATLVFGFGLTLIFFGSKEKSKLLKSGGYILSIIGFLGALCTGYYWMKYYFDGVYEKANTSYSMSRNMGDTNHMGMMENPNRASMMLKVQQCMGSMQGNMMDEKMMMDMQGCMIGKVHGEEKQEEHEAHHE